MKLLSTLAAFGIAVFVLSGMAYAEARTRTVPAQCKVQVSCPPEVALAPQKPEKPQMSEGRYGWDCHKLNTKPVAMPSSCPAGWTLEKACVDDVYKRKCETQTWYASVNIDGKRYCSQRFFMRTQGQCGTVCVPPWARGEHMAHDSKYNGNTALFRPARD